MSDQPIRIAVFGKTGAGKTSFIKRATGADLEVGDGAASTTKKIQQVEVSPDKVRGHTVFLIDTPGFNDTDLEEPTLFLNLAKWLGNSHYNGERLNGAIFLQGINEVRVLKGEEDGVKLFETIVGPKNFPRVIVATTMWDQVEQDFGVRNEENRAKLWHNLRAGDAKFVRFYNTEDSAIEIVRGCLGFPETEFLLQKELIENRGKVGKTSAAKFLYKSLGTKIEDIRVQVRISGGNRKLRQTMRKLNGWLKDLAAASIKFGGLAWRVVATATTMRVWVWETQ
ncbi:P-loop containing nucleoside triphosphate hydrolase protein [Xylaria flabelliformis]|nr:P-loop containing nucleoside triphosphate hydrolase protein [Xylaria flabelliformis]